MAEVLKALQELTVCWKKIGHYNMKCRWFPPAPKTKLEYFALQEAPDHHLGLRGLHEKHFVGAEVDHDKRSDDCAVKFEVQVHIMPFKFCEFPLKSLTF